MVARLKGPDMHCLPTSVCPSSVHRLSVRCLSRGHISKTKQVRSIKNVPTLASCSFDKHGPILIIFGQRHQHTFKNDMHIRLSLSHHFTYFICFKIAAIEKRETMCFPW